MSDQNRLRPSIDLTELERQLREAAGPRQAPAPQVAPAPRTPYPEDPLSELARIVGNDDPYGAPRAARIEPSAAPPEAFEDELAALARHAAVAPSMQPGYRPHHYDDHRQAEPAGGDDEAYHADPDSDFGPAEDTGLDYGIDYGQNDVAYVGLAPRRRNRKMLFATVAVVGLAGAGAAAALMGRNVAGVRVAGAPPIIAADAGPSKVQPDNPGGTVVPNQDRQIYDKQRAEDPKGVKVVAREEQPVDVTQLGRRDAPRVVLANPVANVPGSAPAPSATPNAAKSEPGAPAGIAGIGEPRLVKSVSVRPDGTVIGGQPGESASAGAAANVRPGSPVQPVAAAPPTSAPPQFVVPAPPPETTSSRQTALAFSGVMPLPAPRPGAQSPAPTVAAAAKPVPSLPAAATPARSGAPVQLATVQPGATSEPPAASAGGGDWAVQLAGSPSEADASATAGRLTKRFSNELGGLVPAVRKADVNGAAVYRVRVGGMSREDASALCSKLQAAGGQCFVARN